MAPPLKSQSNKFQPLILMLEDEAHRLKDFKSVLEQYRPDVVLEHWRTASAFMAGFDNTKKRPTLICLDHDLFVDSPNDPDPGDGREVAAFLAQKEPCCHVIIHSSNQPAADSMYFTLLETNWDVERISPIGHDWIPAYWWPTAKPWIT